MVMCIIGVVILWVAAIVATLRPRVENNEINHSLQLENMTASSLDNQAVSSQLITADFSTCFWKTQDDLWEDVVIPEEQALKLINSKQICCAVDGSDGDGSTVWVTGKGQQPRAFKPRWFGSEKYNIYCCNQKKLDEILLGMWPLRPGTDDGEYASPCRTGSAFDSCCCVS